jgi:secondary thiamine-phosphate synthase enzyme
MVKRLWHAPTNECATLVAKGDKADDDTMHTTINIPTHGPGLYEFTRNVTEWVTGSGLLTLFVQHTSASLVIQENADPEVQVDLQNFFARLVPPTTDPSMTYLTHTYEGPDDMPAHIKASLLPTHLSIPVIDGRMVLGTWQGIYLFEHRDRPQNRRVVAQMTG